jgi:MFS family permease
MGAAAGAVFAGRVADRMGRLAMMKLSATLFFICGLGAGLASSIWMFVIFHTVGGIGIGFGSVAARRTSPKSRPRVSAAASVHCSSSPSCAAFSDPWR